MDPQDPLEKGDNGARDGIDHAQSPSGRAPPPPTISINTNFNMASHDFNGATPSSTNSNNLLPNSAGAPRSSSSPLLPDQRSDRSFWTNQASSNTAPSVHVKEPDTKFESQQTDPNESKPSHAADKLPPPDQDEDSNGQNPFAFTRNQLHALVDPKSVAVLRDMGGLDGLLWGLRSSTEGLDETERNCEGKRSLQDKFFRQQNDQTDEVPPRKPIKRTSTTLSMKNKGYFIDRKRIYGRNKLPDRKRPNLFQLFWAAMKDHVIILLSVCAVISLALGLYETFGEPPQYNPYTHEKEPNVEWVEGVAIVVAILIVTIVSSVNDWQKERQFAVLSKKVEDYQVKVVRSGHAVAVSVYDIVVGDVLAVEAGDILTVDGVLIQGHGIKTDESGMTGESDQITKSDAESCIEKTPEDSSFEKKFDPFMISGSQILEGNGRYVVTSVGVNSYHGRTMMAMRVESEVTPLQLRLGKVANFIAIAGGLSALILFVVLFIRFCARLPSNHAPPAQKGQDFLQTLIISVTLLVVAVPEGLPLAVTLALAFATKRMQKDHNLVRVLRACETMGNATTICSDKTGTLTQNRMTVVAGIFGSLPFFDRPDEVPTSAEIQEQDEELLGSKVKTSSSMTSTLEEEYRKLLVDSIAFNSTAHDVRASHVPGSNKDVSKAQEVAKPTFIGSKTETALLDFAALHLGMHDLEEVRTSRRTVQTFPFSSDQKSMGVVVESDDGSCTLFVKGMPERVLGHCNRVHEPSLGSERVQEITEEYRHKIEKSVVSYASKSLRTLGIAYRKFEAWPPPNCQLLETGMGIEWSDAFQDLTLLGVVGIMDPIRPDVPRAVADCQIAGVVVRMVTGDNAITARAIATQCGILTGDGIVMDGPHFRSLDPHDRLEILPKLQVLARSSPTDKQILVQELKQLDNIVAVTGDGTNDGPALKRADVGFSMGQSGTEVAKEASDIILLDDNFSSIVKAILWGRAVNDAVKKFLQFQLTVNVTAVFLTFISAVASHDQTSVLTAVQLLWVNLIMDTLAALALATDPPNREMLDRKPEPKNAPLISFNMWKMIFIQAAYQLTVTLILHFAGNSIFGYQPHTNEMNSIVFNTFVWMQIFNEVNNRALDRNFNCLAGLWRNWLFIAIFLIMVGAQILIMYVGGAAFAIRRIDGVGWAISLVLGIISIPVGFLVRLIPNEFLRKILPLSFMHRCANVLVRLYPFGKKNQDLEQGKEMADQGSTRTFSNTQDVIALVKENLSFVRKVRGGRSSVMTQLRDPVLILPENGALHKKSKLRNRSHSSITSMALMIPVTTLVSEATGRLGDRNSAIDSPTSPRLSSDSTDQQA